MKRYPVFLVLITIMLFIFFPVIAQEENPYEAMPIRDLEGNVYRVIMLETGVWTADNLNTFKLNDGTPIKLIRDPKEWANTKTPAYGWFSNDLKYCTTYGPVYNFYAVATGKLCPKGWHVPTEQEWNDLMDYAGGQERRPDNPAKLKEKGTAHWKAPNTGATNEVFFNALPAMGITFFSDPPEPGTETAWWTSTENKNSIDPQTKKATNAEIVGLKYDFNSKTMGSYQKEAALPVRCKADD
jgi:uncharacterized protein (TIGR02145 family)